MKETGKFDKESLVDRMPFGVYTWNRLANIVEATLKAKFDFDRSALLLDWITMMYVSMG